MNNLDHLVELPTGCGEQNMVKFAPLVSVSKYLQKTGLSSDKVKNLAQKYLVDAYQKQLTFRHSDGSFSAWGPSGSDNGSTWLTAFILQSFSLSFGLKEIKIAQRDIDLTVEWLINKQNSDGSFQNIGKNLYIKHLEHDKQALTAYVLISLLTARQYTNIGTRFHNDTINRALGYLLISDTSDTYALTLELYALKLANVDNAIVTEIEKKLDSRAIVEGGVRYWKKSFESKLEKQFIKEIGEDVSSAKENKADSLDIEITAYILLAKLRNFNKESHQSVMEIAKWLNQQRNSLGGFQSTKDTVVAVEALAKFAALFRPKHVDLIMVPVFNNITKTDNIRMISPSNQLVFNKIWWHDFQENQENRLRLRFYGTGSGIAQFYVKYSTKTVHQVKDWFNLKAKYDLPLEIILVRPKTNRRFRSIIINTSFNGADPTNMAVIVVKIPSGWQADEQTIEELDKDKGLGLKRHIIKEDTNEVELYFDEISKEEKTIRFDFLSFSDKIAAKLGKTAVEALGVVKVFDYYDREKNKAIVF